MAYMYIFFFLSVSFPHSESGLDMNWGGPPNSVDIQGPLIDFRNHVE